MTNPNPPTQHRRNEQRRRLLQGLVGGPVIYTLPIGANVAAASLTCIDKGATAGNAAPRLIEDSALASDNWVRLRVELMKDGSWNYVFVNSQWFTVQPTLNGAWQVVPFHPFVNPPTSFNPVKHLYALVDYNNGTGNTFYPADTLIDQPATASCWNSVHASPPLTGQNWFTI
jgi:hypothetical protein